MLGLDLLKGIQLIFFYYITNSRLFTIMSLVAELQPRSYQVLGLTMLPFKIKQFGWHVTFLANLSIQYRLATQKFLYDWVQNYSVAFNFRLA